MPYEPSAVRSAWTRIDNWLRAHATVSYENLAPPADPREIEEAETAMGLALPDELLQSLACHNGLRSEDMTFPGGTPRSIAEIVSFRQLSMDIPRRGESAPRGQAPPADGKEPWWDPQWIPWAHSNGDAQVIDMREGPDQGRVGIQRHDGSGDFSRSWPSLSAYLEAVADVLEQGGTVLDLSPFVCEAYEDEEREDGEYELYWEPLDESKRSRFSPGGVPAPVSRPLR
ncbi:SMI1/KNR4 family protein [Streptomyces sp. NPDC014734]|uniref:SMI1/KNR4 family protein n=1 Tax=Streptomyces sp. NPDC014734 TaxID=3364886 RepID=UPI0036FA4C0D